jgi:uncharacterized membrane protein HdeD (DUF308 family)
LLLSWFAGLPIGDESLVFGPIGLGLLLIIVGLGIFFVPGVGILGLVLLVVGVLMIVGGFASRRRAAAPPS